MIFDWVLTFQYSTFLNYKVKLEHPKEKGFYFHDVIDREISGLNGLNNKKDHKWMDDQIHSAMEASMSTHLDDQIPPTLGSIFADICPRQQFYNNTFMIFIAVTPVFLLFWAIVEYIHNPDLSADMCFNNALRKYSPVPVLYPRKAKKDVLVSGIQIKKGDHVLISPFLVNETDSGISFGHGRHTCLMKVSNMNRP